MTPDDNPENAFVTLLQLATDEQLDNAQWDRLQALLLNDPQRRARYVEMLVVDQLLREEAPQADRGELESTLLALLRREEPAPPSPAPLGALTPARSWSPLVQFVNRPLVFSLIAAVATLMSILLSLGQFPVRHVSPAHEAARSTSPVVGRLARLIDCDEATGTTPAEGSQLAAGQTLQWARGWGEVELANGVRAILEGPLKLTLESNRRCYLHEGRITIRTPYSARGFTVETPRMRIIDLGTEFGVAVARDGVGHVHVFSGFVRVESLQAALPSRQVAAGESIAWSSEAWAKAPVARSQFVRALPTRRITLDLADLVAGGNGLNKQSQGGLNPTTGERSEQFVSERLTSDGAFHRAPHASLIDGVFIPNGELGPVTLTSTGVRSGKLPPTDGTTWGRIWGWGPRQPEIPSAEHWVERIPGGARMVGMHANVGVTLDLDAVRAMYPKFQIKKFRANLENVRYPTTQPHQPHQLDFWIFIDGKLRDHLPNLANGAPAVPIDLRLADRDRFLTFVSTDADRDFTIDLAVLRNPQLELEGEVAVPAADLPKSSETPR